MVSVFKKDKKKMIIEINNIKHKIHWEYTKLCNGTPMDNKSLDEIVEAAKYETFFNGNQIKVILNFQTKTTCIISNLETKEVIYQSSTINSIKDRYIKNTGRIISLTQAINSLNKETRKKIFNKYNSRKNGMHSN